MAKKSRPTKQQLKQLELLRMGGIKIPAGFASKAAAVTKARLQQNMNAASAMQKPGAKLFGQLNGKLGDEDRKLIEWSFRQLQNQFLGAPIEALRDASKDGTSAHLLEAIRKLFRLSDG